MEAEEGHVTLGMPGRRLPAAGDSDPCISKLGGVPVWHDASTAPATPPVCGNCAKQMLLVAQVYAPVESDRSIYVFGCNDKVCCLKQGGWAVVRNQSSTRRASEDPAAQDAQHDASENVTPQTRSAAPAKAENSWDLDDSEDEDGDVDLNALLAARDETLAASAASAASAKSARPAHAQQEGGQTTAAAAELKQATPAQAAAATMPLERHFPAVTMDIINEPEQEVVDGDLADDKVLAKFSEYMRQAAEEGEETSSLEALQEALRQAQELKRNGGGDDNDDDEDDAASGANAGNAQPQDVDEEQYEAAPPEVRRMLDFQERVKRCPTQVLRYAWGTTPLWYSSMSPKYSTLTKRTPVPKCRCGQPREFELQLMPHALAVLPVEEFAAETAEAKDAESKERQLGCGMDWGTVIVYSCAASCSESNTEFAVVQWS